MGLGSSWKRVSERTKQCLGVKGAGGPDWTPTTNARNVAMIQDSKMFAKQLKILHKEVLHLHKNTESSFNVMKGVLSSPLPRVYDMTAQGPEPVEKSTTMVGHGVAFDVFMGSATEMKAKLQAEVLTPLEQWLKGYRQIKQRNLKVEEIRLELDAKRRLAINMQLSYERKKSKITTASSVRSEPPQLNDPQQDKLEHKGYKLATEENKVERLQQRFKDAEHDVFVALKHLIADTVVLKVYAAVALNVYEASFRHAHTAFDGALAAPAHDHHDAAHDPAHPTTSAGGTPIEGEVSYAQSAGEASGTAAPSWYLAAKQDTTGAGNLEYESDDDTKQSRMDLNGHKHAQHAS